MDSYSFLLVLAIILLSTKFLGTLTKKVNLPQVIGALIAGIVLGPTGFGLIGGTSGDTEFLLKIAKIGVIMLMFLAGIDTDLTELKKAGLASLVVASVGVMVPLIGGTLLYMVFYTNMAALTNIEILEAVFIGVVLTATSVSITVETLRELGKLQGRMGTTILGAAIIDDIIGIIMLTIISSFKSPDVKIMSVLGSIGLYFIFIGIVAFIFYKVFKKLEVNYPHMRRVAIFAFSFCLFMAYISEHFFGIADITGAYFAGLILCNITECRQFIAKKFAVTSYMIFSPVFFASIGFTTNLHGFTGEIMIFSILLLVVAVLSKMVGCGLAAKLFKFNNNEALTIGIGMVSRGEVALIVAQKGEALGLINEAMFPAIVLVVVATTIMTPFMLKMAISRGKSKKLKPA